MYLVVVFGNIYDEIYRKAGSQIGKYDEIIHKHLTLHIWRDIINIIMLNYDGVLSNFGDGCDGTSFVCHVVFGPCGCIMTRFFPLDLRSDYRCLICSIHK